jgi:ribosome maturation factor RimP
VGDELQEIVAPVVGSLGLELVDVELLPGLVRVVVDRDGGVDLDSVSEVTRVVSSVLDEHDPMPGRRYTLEVSSPGLERQLRTPEQFARAVGEVVTLRTLPSAALERRMKGTLEVADADGVVLTGDDLPEGATRVSYADIERARTVFEWGQSTTPPARPGRRSTKPAGKPARSSKKAVAS